MSRPCELVASGEALLAPTIARRLIEEYVSGPGLGSLSTELGALTEREAEVLRMIAHGLSNTEVAGHRIVSQATVKTHVNRILSKLDLRDRVQAVVLVYECGLVRRRAARSWRAGCVASPRSSALVGFRERCSQERERRPAHQLGRLLAG